MPARDVTPVHPSWGPSRDRLNVEVTWEEDPLCIIMGDVRMRSFSGWANWHDIREAKGFSVDFGHIEYLGQRLVYDEAPKTPKAPSWLSELLSSLSA